MGNKLEIGQVSGGCIQPAGRLYKADKDAEPVVITYSLNTFATISSLSFEKNLLINPLIFTTVPLSPVKNCNNFAKTPKEFMICAVIQSIRSYKFHV